MGAMNVAISCLLVSNGDDMHEDRINAKVERKRRTPTALLRAIKLSVQRRNDLALYEQRTAENVRSTVIETLKGLEQSIELPRLRWREKTPAVLSLRQAALNCLIRSSPKPGICS
jgi:cAMP phosphodiesterase